MATWAIGDVHGCWLTLERLLESIRWDPDRDSLWFVGDLVNRGPSSLDVLRWAYENRGRVAVVLGNHDLHLLARDLGVAKGDRVFCLAGRIPELYVAALGGYLRHCKTVA